MAASLSCMCSRSGLNLCGKILRNRPGAARKRLTLRSYEVKSNPSPACRALSTEKGGPATGGLAQAILQEKLQQQQRERAKEEAGSGEHGSGDAGTEQEQKQKQNTAYAKKMVLRLMGLLGAGSTLGVVYVFGEWEQIGRVPFTSVTSAAHSVFLCQLSRCYADCW